MTISEMTITAQYNGSCLSCRGFYKAGDRVKWEKGVGVWHTTCKKPQSVEKDAKLRETRVSLGLEAPEFGSAPMLKRREEPK